MSESIKIEKFSNYDFDKYYQLVGNEKVMSMITERAIPIEEALKDFGLLIQNNNIHASLGSFKVMLEPNDQFMGLAKLEIKESNSKEAELGHRLLPEFWGSGFGNKIARLMLTKAKEMKDLRKIIAVIDPNNLPSRKILINNGFSLGENLRH